MWQNCLSADLHATKKKKLFLKKGIFDIPLKKLIFLQNSWESFRTGISVEDEMLEFFKVK